ncbi:unnamed protein product [marine sediment metagenome]|uniref:Uncharacterized protein n=1 Tax=marine sediment metagenome TaxID=412755 RepID=X0ZNK6_9ZZZZ
MFGAMKSHITEELKQIKDSGLYKAAQFEVVDITAHFLDSADEFMAYDHRRFYRFLGPGVPVENMKVGTTN